VRLEPASELEIEHTRRVMGGDDLDLWANALLYSNLANEGFKVASLSYIGPDFEALRRIYWDGALGGAKKHIDATTRCLDARISQRLGGHALSVMNPAVVTGASVAIPAMLKYIADYLGVVGDGIGKYSDPLDVGIDFVNALYGDGEPWKKLLDGEGRLRLDAYELDPALQAAIQAQWNEAQEGPTGGVTERGLAALRGEFMRLFGWDVDGVDYEAEYEFSPELGEAQSLINLIED
jgi:enoyl-[acyl-carrier protein] reductase/trans-2-enoyl-CoA reductase (NAD+)